MITGQARPVAEGRKLRVGPPSASQAALLLLPVLFIAWMAWQHRWTCDDAFINFRIVRQIEAGHGAVFNVGDRVEAGTSPLWLGVLTVLDLLTPFRIEWIAVFASIAATVGGLTFAMLGTRRALLAMGVAGIFLPLGALVYAVLPPAWDFATSGLEVGLSVFWLGLSWWLLTGRVVASGATRRAAWKPWWVPVVLGLGPLIRPDFLIYSVFFVVALLVLAEPSGAGKQRFAAVGLASAIPISAELFRMAYYGNLVPNTALAKEGTLANWHAGWTYLHDFVGVNHLLLVPLLVLAGAFLAFPLMRATRGSSRVWLLFGLVIAAGLVHGIYVVRVGGDYMHGRMLLPTLFVLLLPVSVVAARGWQWVAVAAVLIWAGASAAVLRPPYSGPPPRGETATAETAIDQTSFISDERLVQRRLAVKSHPVTLVDFSSNDTWADAGFEAKAMLRAGVRGLLFEPYSLSVDGEPLFPMRSDVKAPIVAYVGAVGVYAYAAGDSVEVLDRFGIVNALSAHQKLLAQARVGHEKDLPLAWIFAAFADSDDPIPQGLSAPDVQAARHALDCGELPQLRASTQGSLGPARMLNNIAHSLGLYRFRFNGDPQLAESELCKDGR